MFMFILQTFILVAIAFVVGAVVGCWLRSALGGVEEPQTAAAAKIEETAVSTDIPAQPVAAGASVLGEPAEKETDDAPATDPVPAPLMGEGDTDKPKKAAARKQTAKAAPKRKSASGKAAKTPTRAKAAKPKAPPGKDDLKKIKGVGKVIEGKLNAEGITTYAQIAAWTKKDAEAFSEKLDFQGRIEREDWIAQAKLLEKGERAGG